MQRKLHIAIGLGVLVALLIAAAVVAAPLSQTCGGYTCVHQAEFTSSLDGWGEGNNEAVIQLSTGTTTVTGEEWFQQWTSSADGVLRVTNRAEFDTGYNGPQIQKQISLTTGTYAIIMRVGGNGYGQPKMVTARIYANNAYAGDYYQIDDFHGDEMGRHSFEVLDPSTQNVFYVDRPSEVVINLEFTHIPAPVYGDNAIPTAYVDYIWIVRTSTVYPTSVPGATQKPFAATPQPAATQFCLPRETPTPPPFSLTPTPTGTVSSPIALLERFDNETSRYDLWQPSGNDVYAEYPGRGDNTSWGVNIPSDYITETVTSRPYLAMNLANEYPLFIDGFTYGVDLSAGERITLEIHAFNVITGWIKMGEFAVSNNTWQPFHLAMTNTTYSGLLISAVSNVPGKIVRVDELYVYSLIDYAPFCDGGYPATFGSGSPASSPDDVILVMPSNKICPAPVNMPNNFWGYLLAGITHFMDYITAYLPPHTYLDLANNTESILLTPIGTVFVWLAILFDWQWLFNALIFVLVVLVVYFITHAWKGTIRMVKG